MGRKTKCQFFNLAEQLSTNNEIVSSTMENILKQAVCNEKADQRCDWEEIKKTLDKLNELNGPKRESLRSTTETIRKPKFDGVTIDADIPSSNLSVN